MNERIKELFKEAASDYNDANGVFIPDDFVEKFAELIVRECVTLCESVATNADATARSEYVTDTGRMLHEGMWGGAKNCAGAIQQHFGVEE